MGCGLPVPPVLAPRFIRNEAREAARELLRLVPASRASVLAGFEGVTSLEYRCQTGARRQGDSWKLTS